IPVMAKAAGFKNIGEKVVQHRARKYGVSKFGWNRFINGFIDLLTIQFTTKFGKKPMHFFGTIGSLMFILGMLLFLYMVIMKFVQTDYYLTNNPQFFIALTAILLGSIFFSTGFLAELTIRNSPERNVYLIDE